MDTLDKLIAADKAAKESAALAAKELRDAKARARWTALEAVRTASSAEGARWIRAALDGVVEMDPRAVAADYIIGRMRYSWARKGRKAPKAVIRDGAPAIVYIYTERPAPTDDELASSWNMTGESTRLMLYAIARARSSFAVPDDGSASEASLFVKAVKS